jgi:hypothetical protein
VSFVRPKVLFNDATKEYVMWFHLDTSDYQYRHAGVATSSNPAGPFVFAYALQPDGIPSLDMSLFKDPLDGTAYFIRSCDNAVRVCQCLGKTGSFLLGN